MDNRAYSRKELTASIISAEIARQSEIKELTLKLHKLEMQEDMCDTDNIDEIIGELNVIDPLPENHNYEKSKKISQGRVKARIKKENKSRKKPLMVFKVSAVFAAIILSVQVISVVAFEQNFFGSVANWTKDMFVSLVGTSIQKGNTVIEASHTREYKTVEEFEKAEGIKILTTGYMPNGTKVEAVLYGYEYETKTVIVRYDDNTTVLMVMLNDGLPDTKNDWGAESYEHGGIVFYVFKEAKGILWEHENNFYNLTCGFEIDEYEKIIESIK